LQLRVRGLTVTYRPVTELELQQWIAQRIPVILLVDTAQLPYWSRRTAHAVVLVGLDGSTAYVKRSSLRDCSTCPPLQRSVAGFGQSG
jgi:hypothetical protein